MREYSYIIDNKTYLLLMRRRVIASDGYSSEQRPVGGLIVGLLDESVSARYAPEGKGRGLTQPATRENFCELNLGLEFCSPTLLPSAMGLLRSQALKARGSNSGSQKFAACAYGDRDLYPELSNPV